METQSASERISRVIFSYAARISQEQDTDALLRLNADMARDLLGAERCSIWLVDPAAGQLYTTVAHGVGEIRMGLNDGLVGACVGRSESIVVNNTASDERFFGGVDEASGFLTHSVLVIPLRAEKGSVIGAIQALNKTGGFSESDIVLLGLAGSFSAAAIEAQRLREEAQAARIVLRELAIAHDVQAGLLPQTNPALDGLECAAFFRPAQYVGGDYYDFIETAAGTLVFTLGDVSGKGIPAAVLMASIQASLRIQLLRGPESLPRVVADLNTSVSASSTADRYSTLFCGSIDPRSRRLAYVNAGQCAPMLARYSQKGCTIEHLTAGGTPPGLLPGAQYEEGATVLQKGDALVCFSDGISEARNSTEEFWQESCIEDILRNSSGASAQELTDRIVREVDAFAAAADQADDMTILTIRAR